MKAAPRAPGTRSPAPRARKTNRTQAGSSPSRRFGVAVSTVFALAGAALMLLVIAPDLQARHQWLAMAASFAPYGWVCWLVAVVVAVAATRQRLLVLPLVAGLVAHTLTLLPYLPGTPTALAGQKATLAVLELNLRFGLANTDQLSAEVDRTLPDVVVLTEVTQSNQRVLKSKAWRERLPYRLGTAKADADPATGYADAGGTMVLSRFRLTELDRTKDTAFTNLAARVALPGHPFVLVAAHPGNPSHGLDRWLHDGQAVAQLAAAHTGEPLVVAGDLNATAEHLTLRELKVRAGLTDTATGNGWHPTYPADTWYPPLIQIDHVLASAAFTTTALNTFAVAGTDHLGLSVRLAITSG